MDVLHPTICNQVELLAAAVCDVWQALPRTGLRCVGSSCSLRSGVTLPAVGPEGAVVGLIWATSSPRFLFDYCGPERDMP